MLNRSGLPQEPGRRPASVDRTRRWALGLFLIALLAWGLVIWKQGASVLDPTRLIPHQPGGFLAVIYAA